MISITELYDIFLQHPRISTDTRNIAPGSIFFALKGDNFNGNQFAVQAIEKGAAYAVVDESPGEVNSRCLETTDVLKTLQLLALHHRLQLKIPVVAVTGSNGKTTTKELLYAVLSSSFRCMATKGNLNNHIGVPLSILSITKEHDIAVIEMGANHKKEIEQLCEIAWPSHGLITNVGKAHLEGFGGFEGVKQAKGELYTFLAKSKGTGFINNDNAWLLEMAEHTGLNNLVRYGTTDTSSCQGEMLSTVPFLKIRWIVGNNRGVIQSQLPGEYNFENILAAVCVGNFFQVPAEKLNQAIETYAPDNSRSQVVKKGSNQVILDAYNANPTSMAAALKNFSAADGARKIIFLGEMSELGAESEQEHQAIADMVNTLQFDELVLVGKKFSPVTLSKPAVRFDSSAEAAVYAAEKKYSNATILIKGSRSTKMEKVFEAI